MVDEYRPGLVPLIVPLTLLKHHLNRYTMPDGCLCPAQRRVHQQVYLHPYPEELMPRNHEWIQSLLVDRTGEGFVATLPTVC